MIWLSRPPAAPLDRSIATIWYWQCAPRPFAFERVLPKGAAQLVVNLKEDRTRTYDLDGRRIEAPGAVVSGLATTFEIIDTDEQEHVVGVSFRPGGTRAFCEAPASELVGRDVALADLWPAAHVRRLREQLLEAPRPSAALDVLEAALASAWRDRPLHRASSAALRHFLQAPEAARVSAVAEAAGMSVRRFIDAFTTDVGLTPKQFCRVRRFQHAVAAAHRGAAIDWADLAVAAGYYDQAHFIRDFRAFSGVTPTGYRAARTAFQNHVTFVQSTNPPRDGF